MTLAVHGTYGEIPVDFVVLFDILIIVSMWMHLYDINENTLLYEEL